MNFIGKKIFKKIKGNEDLINLKAELDQLKENVIYSQRLAQIGSWTHDIRKDEVFLSNEVYNILGCSPREFDGKLEHYYSLVHPDDLEEVKKAIQGALKGIEYNIEFRIITPDKIEKYVHEKTKIIFDENKNPTIMFGIIKDITEHKLIENNLKVLGENLNQAQRVAGVGSWKYNVQNDQIFWSEEVYQIYGINPLDFKKDYNSYINLIYPEDQSKVQNVVEECLNGKSYEIEHRISQLDDTVRYVVGKGEPIFDEKRRVISIIGTVQDITEKKLLEEALKKSNKNLAEAQRLAHLGSWEMDMASGKNYMSDETFRIYGIAPEQFNGTYEGFLNLVYPEDRQIIEKNLKNPPEEQPFDMEFRVIRSDGSVRNVYQLVKFIFDKDGNPIYIFGTIQDITEKKELQKEIEHKQQEIDKIQRRYKVLVQESSDVFKIIDSDGTIKYVSGAVEKITGYKPEEQIGRKVNEFYEGAELQKVIKMLELVLDGSGKDVQGDVIFKTKSGKNIYLEVRMKNLIKDSDIEGIVVNFRDITSRVEMEKRMAHISTHDDLTDLPNKIFLKKKLKLQCKYANETNTKFALMILEIGGLKNLNYTIGYEYENHLFIEVVKRLKFFLGDYIFISRISEYKLAIIVQGLRTNEGYEKLTKELLDIMKKQFIVDKFEIGLSANIGICTYPDESEDPMSVEKNSNIALLRAKREGKNSYKFYSSGLDIQYYKEFVIRNDLQKAIENNQLKVYYQPIVNLKTNEIIAAEALIRWEHPDWGILSPNEFIPLAEESGVIIEVGKWMLKEVCRNYKKWIKNKRPSIKVSVNFSSIQFLENNFAENIINLISEFMLNPHFLIMEITESILINTSERFFDDIKKLQSYGIQLALDDFGTGYSSLTYLNAFKIDILKIDGSFINKIIEDKTSNTITKTIINMAKELNIKIAAEGIENWEQLAYLRGLNCIVGQGYLYSKPLPLESFEIELARGKCRPSATSNTSVIKPEDRRKFFRINFHQMLETDMTIINFKGKNVNVGNTKVLVKNVGPGGLFFVSNIKLPIDKDITLLFVTNLLNIEVKIYGHPIRLEEYNNLYEYGVEFTVDENERADLIKILNLVQIKMRKDILFSEGSFISGSAELYFKS